MYFVASFSQPFAGFTTWQDDAVAGDRAFCRRAIELGVDLSLVPTNRPQAVTLKLAISYVSIENARTNLQSGSRGQGFRPGPGRGATEPGKSG